MIKKEEHRLLLYIVLSHRLWYFTYKPFLLPLSLCISLQTFFFIIVSLFSLAFARDGRWLGESLPISLRRDRPHLVVVVVDVIFRSLFPTHTLRWFDQARSPLLLSTPPLRNRSDRRRWWWWWEQAAVWDLVRFAASSSRFHISGDPSTIAISIRYWIEIYLPIWLIMHFYLPLSELWYLWLFWNVKK